ncbi:MAG: hybrid sensor histidine kinase/response regulator [Rhodanobacter sp.]
MNGTRDFWFKRLWRRATLMQRLAFVTLVPTFATASLLVVMVTRYQLNILHDMGQNTAVAIATQAAAVSADPLQRDQRRELIRIAQSIADLPQVAHVQIRSADGEILAESHGHGRIAQEESVFVERNVMEPNGPAGRAPLGSVLVEVSIADAVAAQHASLRNALITLGLSLLMATLLCWQAARWISAPLRRLAAAVHQLGRSDRPVAVEVTDQTEIGELQSGFNASAAALFDMKIGMQQKIERATLELASKNAALEAANVAKARFLAAATHDLRQPLYALTLFSSALVIDEHDPVRLDRITHVQECVQALDHLFSELLDLSRLETGMLQIEISEFALDDVFEEVSCNFRMIAEQHDLRLVMRTTGLWVRSDRTMIARILNNLVSNALRYTEHGGVLVGARKCAGDRVRIDVWDTGSGILPEHQKHVFDEFYRVERPDHGGNDEGHRRGLGLGLSTVKRLAELLDTEVQLRSRVRRGSVFTFHLPEVPARQRLRIAESTPVFDLAGMQVLVIDDEPAILAGIRYLLRSWGCDVVTAEDREQALEAVGTWIKPPDLVISDLRLRDGNSGLDVLAALDFYYQRDGARPFARLLITGETRSDRLREIKAAKIPVLYKPVSPEQLREAMMVAWTSSRNAE